MNLLRALLEMILPPVVAAPSSLRNSPGGLAWIKAHEGCGTEELIGHVVKTELADPDGFWLVTPEQPFKATKHLTMANGRTADVGAIVRINRIHDDSLEPIRRIRDSECTEELEFQPTLPYGREIPNVNGTKAIRGKVLWSMDL